MRVSITVLRCCLRSLGSYFKEFVLNNPTLYQDLGIAVYPFDSASKTLFAARGKIPRGQFVMAGRRPLVKPTNLTVGEIPQRPENQVPIYRIAILHHHPLPIPYDSSQEPLMVLDNAGAFLNEISQLKIRLVLHGHKHHRHFSRVTINAEQEDEFEVAVLSTGTPTAGKRPGRFGYNFNFLSLDNNWNVEIRPYQASEGRFTELKPFLVENPDLTARRLYEQFVEQQGLEYASSVSMVEVSPDGDAYNREEYRGFKIVRKGYLVAELPTPVSVSVTHGYIERFNAAPLDQYCTAGFHLDREKSKFEFKSQEGLIKFGQDLGWEDAAINFFYHYHAINSYAMSVQQHREMYGENAGPPIEWTEVMLERVPCKELVMILKFPAEFSIEGKPKLIIENDKNEEQIQLQKRFEENLVHDLWLNLVICRIPFPPVGLKYRLQWRLSDKLPSAGRPVISLAGEAEKLAEKLLRIPLPTPDNSPLRVLFESIDSNIRRVFVLESREQDPIDMSIMVYDREEKSLKVAAANFAQEDQIWCLRLGYGDGIAGRAYKMNKARLFVKALAIREKTPFFYCRGDGKPISDARDVPDEVVISIPLCHPKEARAIYGVFNISSRNPSSRLLDLKEDERGLTEFRQAVNEACFEVLKALK